MSCNNLIYNLWLLYIFTELTLDSVAEFMCDESMVDDEQSSSESHGASVSLDGDGVQNKLWMTLIPNLVKIGANKYIFDAEKNWYWNLIFIILQASEALNGLHKPKAEGKSLPYAL